MERQEADKGNCPRRPGQHSADPAAGDCLLPQERHVQHLDPYLPPPQTKPKPPRWQSHGAGGLSATNAEASGPTELDAMNRIPMKAPDSLFLAGGSGSSGESPGSGVPPVPEQ